mgnify:CR=1 FL=1
MKAYFLRKFKKSYARRVLRDQALDKRFGERFLMFIQNPNHPLLRDHALRGEKKGLRSFSVTGDIRVTYFIEDNIAYFLDIGSHNQVF